MDNAQVMLEKVKAELNECANAFDFLGMKDMNHRMHGLINKVGASIKAIEQNRRFYGKYKTPLNEGDLKLLIHKEYLTQEVTVLMVDGETALVPVTVRELREPIKAWVSVKSLHALQS